MAGGPDTGGRTSFSGRSFEPSRADESSTWGRSRSSTRDYDDEPRAGSRSGGFEELGPSRADTEDRWGSKGFVPSERAPNRSDSGTWGSSARRSSSPPASAPNRPRLQLKPRTLPVPDLPVAKSAPSSESGASASASEPADASLSVKVTAPPTKRSNPFGVARPREEVLKEQGKDSAQVEAEYAQRASDRCRHAAVWGSGVYQLSWSSFNSLLMVCSRCKAVMFCLPLILFVHTYELELPPSAALHLLSSGLQGLLLRACQVQATLTQLQQDWSPDTAHCAGLKRLRSRTCACASLT